MPNLTGVNGLVEISAIGKNGLNGIRLGKSNDNTGYTTNALDLHLNLENQSGLQLSFWIYDNNEETHPEDGIFASADNGLSFVKIFDFQPEQWCNQYGQLPPLNLDELVASNGLAYSDQFVLRFQQHDNQDFSGSTSNDGFYLDDILLEKAIFVYATLPYFNDFENGSMGTSLARSFADATMQPITEASLPSGIVAVAEGIGHDSNYGLKIGKACEDGYNANAVDLHLNLENESNVVLSFWLRDFNEETDPQDGLFFSDDHGATFFKVLDFEAGLWCNQYGKFPSIDIGKLAAEKGLSLTAGFVIRFQQYDDEDFSGSNTIDGFYLDDIQVYRYNKEYSPLSYINDFENGQLWQFLTTDAPSNALLTGNSFRLSGLVEVVPGIGFNSDYAVRMGKSCDDGYTVNTLDLGLKLAGETEVAMTYRIRDNNDETNDQDGIYFSDDGGENFVKVFDFKPELWCDQYGKFPPLMVHRLAAENGLAMTDQFIIRFQQYDDHDFSGNTTSDGIYLDDIHVYRRVQEYSSLPYVQTFEAGTLGSHLSHNLCAETAQPSSDPDLPASMVEVLQGIGTDSTYGVRLGKSCEESWGATALDLYLDLLGKTNVACSFDLLFFGDETQDQDAIFLSNDGGVSFTRIFSLNPDGYDADEFIPILLDIDELAAENNIAFTEQMVLRIQQYGQMDFTGNVTRDGFYLDNIIVQSITSNIDNHISEEKVIKLNPNPVNSIIFLETKSSYSEMTIVNLLGQQQSINPTKNPATIDVSGLTPGVYFLKLKIEGTIFTTTFVKF